MNEPDLSARLLGIEARRAAITHSPDPEHSARVRALTDEVEILRRAIGHLLEQLRKGASPSGISAYSGEGDHRFRRKADTPSGRILT